MKILYKVWTKRKANLEFLRPFGCLTYSLIPKERQTFKLNPTSEKGIMLGYKNNLSSYQIYKIVNKVAVRVQNVRFDKSVFPGLKTSKNEETKAKKESEIFNFDQQTPSLREECSYTQNEQSNSINEEAVTQIPKTPKEISSTISPENILTVYRQGNSIIAYLTENVSDNTPTSYVQAINSPDSLFWKEAIKKGNIKHVQSWHMDSGQ